MDAKGQRFSKRPTPLQDGALIGKEGLGFHACPHQPRYPVGLTAAPVAPQRRWKLHEAAKAAGAAAAAARGAGGFDAPCGGARRLRLNLDRGNIVHYM